MDGKDEHKSHRGGVGSTPIPRRGAETRVCQNGLCVVHGALSFTPLVSHLRETLRKTSHFCGPGLSMECWRKNEKY